MTVIGYIALYAPAIDKIAIEDVAEKRPFAIYTGILSGIGAWLSFIIAFWPIWGLITPILVSVIGMAAMSITNFLPSF